MLWRASREMRALVRQGASAGEASAGKTMALQDAIGRRFGDSDKTQLFVNYVMNTIRRDAKREAGKRAPDDPVVEDHFHSDYLEQIKAKVESGEFDALYERDFEVIVADKQNAPLLGDFMDAELDEYLGSDQDQ